MDEPDDPRIAHSLALLSTQERQIFQLARDGRPDAEIAVRMGMAIGTVRELSESVQRKLGVADRRALVGWTPTAGPAPDTGRKTSRRMPLMVGGLAAVAALLGLALVVSLVMRDDGQSDSPSVAPPSIAQSPTPRSVNGVQLRTFSWGEPVPIPRGFALIVETGCDGCEPSSTQPRTLELVTRHYDGELGIELLFDRASLEPRDYLGRFVASRDTRVIAVAVTPGPPGDVPSSARTRILISGDRGHHWDALATLDGAASVALAVSTSPPTPVGALISRRNQNLEPSFEYWPPGRLIDHPSGLTSPWEGLDGDMAWSGHTTNGYEISRLGQVVFSTNDQGLKNGMLVSAWNLRRQLTVSFPGPATGTLIDDGALLLVNPDGTVALGFEGANVSPAGFVSNTQMIANVTLPAALRASYGFHSVPAIVDVQSGVISPIVEPFGSPPYKGERNRVVGVGPASN